MTEAGIAAKCRARLTAADATVELDHAQITRVKALLLELIPATQCDVDAGPGITITVPNHGVDELAPGVRADIEATIGCPVRVVELPD